MTSRPHRLKKTSSMQSKRRGLHHTRLHRETNEKPSYYFLFTTMNNHNLFNTVFISDTGNKSVRILTSAKALIPLQKRFAQYANVFRIDAKAKKEDLSGAFEGHVKHVEEVITFLNHHEHKALERTGKQNTNGPDFTIPRATRQSFLIVLESLTSLANTLTEIGHELLLYRIFFESMTILIVEWFFKGMRADHDMPTVANYPFRRARCVQDDMLRICQKDFSYFTGPN